MRNADVCFATYARERDACPPVAINTRMSAQESADPPRNSTLLFITKLLAAKHKSEKVRKVRISLEKPCSKIKDKKVEPEKLERVKIT